MPEDDYVGQKYSRHFLITFMLILCFISISLLFTFQIMDTISFINIIKLGPVDTSIK